MTFQRSRLGEHGNSNSGVIAQQRVRKNADAGRELSLDPNVRNPTRCSPAAVAEPLMPLPRRRRHRPN